MLRNVIAVARKELLVISKDRGSLMVLFLLPLVLASVFGSISQAAVSAVEGDESLAIPAIVVNLDEGPYGEQVVRTLEGVSALDLRPLASVDEAESRISQGEALAAVILPADLSANVDAYVPSTVRVVVDPAQAAYGAIITGMMSEVLAPVALQGELRYGIHAVVDRSGVLKDASPAQVAAMEAQTLGAIMTRLQEMQQSPWIDVRAETPRAGLPGALEPLCLHHPLLFGDVRLLSGRHGGAVDLAGARAGSLRRLLAGPVRAWEIIAGKIVAYMLVICLQAVVLFSVGALVFSMPLGKSFAGLAVLTVALALVSTSLGALISTLAKSSRQADGGRRDPLLHPGRHRRVHRLPALPDGRRDRVDLAADAARPGTDGLRSDHERGGRPAGRAAQGGHPGGHGAGTAGGGLLPPAVRGLAPPRHHHDPRGLPRVFARDPGGLVSGRPPAAIRAVRAR